MSGLSQPFRQGPDGEVNHLEVSEEPQTKQYVIYWDDIRRVYRKALHIKNGSMIVNLARNQHGQCYEPDCIKYYPGVTLEVVEGEDSDTQTSSIPLAKVFAAPSAPTSDYYNPPLTCAQAHNTAKLSLFESTEPSLTLGSLTIHETATATAASSTVLVSTSINRTAFVSPTPISHRLLQRTQSMLQESSTQLVRYESSLQAGQIVQADAIMQGMQAMRKDIQEEFRVLHSEVAKSEELKELKQLIQEMKATADVQTKRIIELQELSVKLQQEALDRLALMQIKIASILTQTYELHEYPIPRLFIVLPKEDATRTETAGRGVKNLFAKQFKLYFLCECGDHTKSHDGPATNPSLKHEIHIALHEGYDIDRPTEFFDKYGPYILTLLQMLKYGVTIAGVVVPPLGKLSVVDSLKDVADGINHVLKDIGPRVDSSIAYIEKLTGIQSQLSTADSTSSLTDPTTLGGPEALEGADLRQLDSFLKTKDKGRVLGNLYRIVTGEGHVKWVCLDHYRENYRAKATQDLRDAIEEVLGIYNESTGSVQAWPWSSRVARRFYSVLSSSRCVQELSLYFRWKPSMQDLRDLRDAIKSTNIGHIRITSEDNTPPRSDLLNNGRRFEPILQMISSGNIRSLELEGWGGFLERISNVPVTLGVRRLRIQTIEEWTKRLPRLISIIQASPLLTELSLEIDHDVHLVFDPVIDALKNLQRPQGLKLTVMNARCEASVEIEAHTGRSLYVDLRVKKTKEADPFNHSLVRNLVIEEHCDLPSILIQVQKCIEHGAAVESIEIACDANNFVEWLESFRKLLTKYSRHTPRLVFHARPLSLLQFPPEKQGTLTSSNIQGLDRTEINLESISYIDISSGYLSSIPDTCVVKAAMFHLGSGTTISDINTLQQMQANRRESLSISALNLQINDSQDTEHISFLLEAFQDYIKLYNVETRIELRNNACALLGHEKHSQHAVRHFIYRHATHITLSGPRGFQWSPRVFDGQFCQLKELQFLSFTGYKEEQLLLTWILSTIRREPQALGDEAITESGHSGVFGEDDFLLESPMAATTLHQPCRLSKLSFSSCSLDGTLWLQLVRSIDIMPLREFKLDWCRTFTNEHLIELLSRCISAKDTSLLLASPTNSSKPPSIRLLSDPCALQDLKDREHQHLHITLVGTRVTSDQVENEKVRLREHGVDWVKFTFSA